MVLHGMRIRVKDELSRPNEADKQTECRFHGGIEAIRTCVKVPGICDEFKLLRLRHKSIHRPDNSSLAPTPSEVDIELEKAARSLSIGKTHEKQLGWSSQSSQDDVQHVEHQLASFGFDIFEGDYIELDAGDHEDFLQRVADDMKRLGDPLKTLVDDFANRATVYSDLVPRMQVQESFVKLGNALSQQFFAYLPGYWEGEDGVNHTYTAAGDVFSSRGRTFIKQESKGGDVPDGPKPELLPFRDARFLVPIDWDGMDTDGSFPDPQEEEEKTWIAQNKPDIINNYFGDKAILEDGMTWKEINLAFEVSPEARSDCVTSLLKRIHHYQVNQIKQSAATGEVLTLTICGDVIRVWYANPQRFGSTRGFSLNNPDHFYDIVKIVALFSGPVSNYLPQWKPLAGPEGRLGMLSGQNEAFFLELKDVHLLDSRFDMFGKRTAVWSAGLAHIKSTSEEQEPPIIDLEEGEQLVIKTSWHITCLRHHEHNVYQHIERRESELKEQKGFERDPEVEIPSLIGMLSDEHHSTENLACIGDKPLSQWKTRSVRVDPLKRGGNNEHLQFTILITKCRQALPIERLDWTEWELIEIYRKLFKNLKHLALMGVHYRDLNLGNILCDASKKFCLLADLDFARIGTQRRGEIDHNNSPSIVETSLDDCVTGNPLFRSGHLHDSLRRRETLIVARRSLKNAEEYYKSALAKLPPEENASVIARRELKLAYKRKFLEQAEHEMTLHQHRYIDDLESGIYTMLWVAASQSARRQGLTCGPLTPFANLDDRGTKWVIWTDTHCYAEALGIFSDEWCDFVDDLCIAIRAGQDNEAPTFDNKNAEEPSENQKATYDRLNDMMNDFLVSTKKSAEQK